MKKNYREKLCHGREWYGVCARKWFAGGALIYATRQTTIKFFSAGVSLEKFVAAQFSGFLKKGLMKGKAFVCKITPPEAVAETML